MNDELFKVLVTILGTVITLGITYLITKLTKIENTQVTQAISFARLEGTVTGLSDSINGLRRWRNEQQEREYSDLKEQLRKHREKNND